MVRCPAMRVVMRCGVNYLPIPQKIVTTGILGHVSKINSDRVFLYISHNQGIIRRNTDLYYVIHILLMIP